eukprot:m.213250 g.213250  ORF g.213250 m.213250 type:complete len:1318 (-) comp33144_c0_seq3:38-3991(-)
MHRRGLRNRVHAHTPRKVRRSLRKTQFVGHVKGVNSVCLSHDDTYLFSGSGDGTIIQWTTHTCENFRQFVGHSQGVTSVCVSQDDAYLFSGARDSVVIQWDVTNGSVIQTFKGHSSWVLSVCLSNNNAHLFTGSHDATIMQWDITTAEPLHTFSGHTSAVNSVCVSGNSSQLFTASSDRTIIQWDTRTHKRVKQFRGHSSCVESICVTSNSTKLFSASLDKTVIQWDIATGERLKQFRDRHTNSVVRCVCLTRDDKYLFSGSWDETVVQWDIATATIVKRFINGRPTSTDTTRVAVSTSINSINSLCISNDNSVLYSAGDGEIVGQWDITTCERITRFRTAARTVCLSSDNKHLFTGGTHSDVMQWDTATSEIVHHFKGHTDWVNAVCLSSDDENLYSGSGDATIIKWNAITGEKLQQLRGHTDFISSLCISRDGRVLYSAGRDKSIVKWDVRTGKEARRFNGGDRLQQDGDGHTAHHHDHQCHFEPINCLRLSPDEKHLFSASSDKTIKQWDTDNGHFVRRLEDDRSTKAVTCVCVSVDGQHIFSGSWDKTATQWDISSGAAAKIVRQFQGHRGCVTSIALAFDDTMLFTASRDTVVMQWGVATGDVVQQFTLQTPIWALHFSHNNLFDTLVVACTTEVVALPHMLQMCGPSNVIAGWRLHQLVAADSQQSEPDNRYVAVANEIAKSRANVISNESFFLSLARSGRILGLRRCLFEQDMAASPFSYGHLLAAAIQSKSSACIHFILSQAAKSVVNINDVRHRAERAHHMLSDADVWSDDGEFVRLLLQLPHDPLLNFLENLPLRYVTTATLATYESEWCAPCSSIESLIATSSGKEKEEEKEVEEREEDEEEEEGMRARSEERRQRQHGAAGKGAAGSVLAEKLVTPFAGFTRSGKGSFLWRLLECSTVNVFGTIVAKYVVAVKWNGRAARFFWVETAAYLTSVVAVVAATFATSHVTLQVLFAILSVFTVGEMFIEFNQRSTPGYFFDLFTYVRLSSIASTITASVVLFADHEDTGADALYAGNTTTTTVLGAITIGNSTINNDNNNNVIISQVSNNSNNNRFQIALSVLVYLKWFGVYYYLQPVPMLGPVVRMITAVLFDIKDIILVTSILILGLANGLYVLLKTEGDHHGYDDASDALYTTYKMLLLGDFDDSMFAVGDSAVLIKCMFVVSSLLGTIVILNVLIARMSDSYERIQSEAEMERCRLQASIIRKYEIIFRSSDDDLFLNVVLAVGKNHPKVERTAWAGALNHLKESLGERINEVKKQNMTLEKQCTNLKHDLNVHTGMVKEHLEDQDRQLKALAVMLQTVLTSTK